MCFFVTLLYKEANPTGTNESKQYIALDTSISGPFADHLFFYHYHTLANNMS